MKVGVRVVLFAALSSVGLLLVVSGLFTTGYGATGIISLIPLIGGVFITLAIFVKPYVTMTQYTRSSGAMYAIVNEALGPVFGVPVAWIAIFSYNLLQVALYGLMGYQLHVVMAPSLTWSWWAYAALIWLVATAIAQLPLSKMGLLLTVFATLEVLAVAALAWRGLTNPASESLAHAIYPAGSSLVQESSGIAIIVLAFIGFETTLVYALEVASPRKTIARATYLAIALPFVLFTAGAWAMQARWGSSIAKVSLSQGPETFFSIGGHRLDVLANDFLVLTIGAALIAYAAGVVRYKQAAAYKGMLPRVLARSSRSGVPRQAAAVQSAFGAIAIIVAAAFHWNPLTQLFFIVGTIGGDGILLLLTVTAVAIAVYFRRHPEQRAQESTWTAVAAPWISAVLLAVGLGLANWHFDLNVGEPGDRAARLWPLMFVAIALAGVSWALWTKRFHPARFLQLRDQLSRVAPAAAATTAGGVR